MDETPQEFPKPQRLKKDKGPRLMPTSRVKVLKPNSKAPKERTAAEVVAPILLKTRITRKALANYTQSLLVTFAPHILPEALRSLHEKVVAGDKDGMNQAFEIYGLKNAKQGGTLVQILNQMNGGGGAEPERQESGYRRSMEFVLREQEKRKQIEAGNVIEAVSEQVLP